MLDFTCYLNSILWHSPVKGVGGSQVDTPCSFIQLKMKLNFFSTFFRVSISLLQKKCILGSLILHCIYLPLKSFAVVSQNLPSDFLPSKYKTAILYVIRNPLRIFSHFHVA